MTEIVFITDIHGNFEAVSRIFIEEEPDFVFIGGDLTDFGPLDGVIDMIDDIPCPVFVIPGNCDPREIVQIIDASDGVSLHKKSIDIGDITILGLGGSNITPFNTLFENSEEEIAETFAELLPRMKKNRWNILMTHAPPKGALDGIGEGGSVHVGSEEIAKVVKNFDLVCCGHIHEQKNITEFEGRICVNPGPAKDGNYAVIVLDEDSEPVIALKNVNGKLSDSDY